VLIFVDRRKDASFLRNSGECKAESERKFASLTYFTPPQ
jgi:hypothetical protein